MYSIFVSLLIPQSGRLRNPPPPTAQFENYLCIEKEPFLDGVLLISLSRFCREAKHSESLFFCALSEMMFQDLLEALRALLQVPEVFSLGTTKLFFAQKQKNRALRLPSPLK